MGGGTYNFNDRNLRSQSYQKATTDQIFEQNQKRQMHPEMNPKGVTIREARDSENHPLSIPIIIALDVTASMGHIPEMLVKSGLPKIISGIIEAGLADPQIMFIAIGDHITDRAPLQISQFESGDAELDMWLTRVWLEGGGGGNYGESYSLAHYFASRHTVTDHWEKRNQKGFLFTIGDERFHENYSASAMTEIMGGESSAFTAHQLLIEAMQKWNVFHILPGKEQDSSRKQWTDFLGEAAIYADDHTDIPAIITRMVVNMSQQQETDNTTITPKSTADNSDDRPGAGNKFL